MNQSKVIYLCAAPSTGCPHMQIHITPPANTDTRSTFSGAADYDQTTPFNGLTEDAA